MRRYLYRCPVCRTTSDIVHTVTDAENEAVNHREELHGRHHPDGQFVGEIDRRRRWYADLGLLAALHARIADGLADIRDPNGMGGRLWASVAAWLALIAGAASVLWVTATALHP
ncbi:hypothetical protein ACGFOU_01885 [Streptomyces sp. NPDC048595]|uniref:hypothetical protein n=1 Tax=Streptomyces sp. NPDC048595 TaxID=3365576 RepID=UPI00371E149B